MKIVPFKYILFSLIMFSVCSTASASDPPLRHYMPEEQLRSICTPNSGDLEDEELLKLKRAMCQTYVLGVVDGHDAWSGITKNAKRAFCLPEGTFNAQLTDAVISSLKGRLPFKDGIGAFLVFEALHNAFPCGAESR